MSLGRHSLQAESIAGLAASADADGKAPSETRPGALFRSGETRGRRRSSVVREMLPPTAIRRGMSVRNVLSHFGRAFRVSPNSLEHAEKTRLYEQSERVDSIHAFISNSWGSAGYQKFLSLLYCTSREGASPSC